MKRIQNFIFTLCTITLLAPPLYTHASMLITDEVPIINSNALRSPLAPPDPAPPIRFVTLYIPQAVFDNPTERFPVVYYLPGLGGDNLSFTAANQQILDNLIAARQIIPFIVVHVDPSLANGIDPEDGKRRYQGTWYINSELNGNFEDFVTQDLIPYIDANYPTLALPEFRGVMGQSMGGFGSLFLATKHPELFCGMGAASGTPFWAILTDVVPFFVDPGSIDTPGDQMFVMNSLILPEIPTSGVNAGKVTPDNGQFTFSVFSYAAAHSPNVNNPPYFVDLPFEVNPNNTPVLVNGSFEISQTSPPGNRIPITASLVPRQEVIDRWKINNPFYFITDQSDTLQNQAIFFDGGDVEIINAAGARVYSDTLAENTVDHEYLLYQGDHTQFLIAPEIDSRHRTMFQMFSAKFAQAGVFTQNICTNITGNQTITLAHDDVVQITGQELWCIQTDPDNNITETHVTIEITDNAKLILGSNTNATPQGGLQIGNPFSKARLEGNPALKDHKITCTILINGPNACLEIQQGGFLGLGAGIEGFASTNVNQWAISTLTNVESVTIDVRQGKFIHNLMPTPINHQSLFAIGLSKLYNLFVDPDSARIFGGGSTIGMEDNYLSHPVAQSIVGLDPAEGIRNLIDFNEAALDFFFDKPMGSSVFYFNSRDIGLLASSGQLDNQVENGSNPYTITESIAEIFCDRVSIDENDPFTSLASKEATLTKTGNTIELTYINDDLSIICVPATKIEIGQNQQLDLEEILENRGYADIVIRMIDGKEVVLRVDDPEAEVDSITA